MDKKQKWSVAGVANQDGTILALLQGSHDQMVLVWFCQDQKGIINAIYWHKHGGVTVGVPAELIEDSATKDIAGAACKDFNAWVRKNIVPLIEASEK